MKLPRPTRWTLLRVLTYGLILVVVVPLLLYVIGQFVGFYGGYVVLSNSMVPEFHSGDVVYVQNTAPSAVQIHDVITYHSPDGDGTTTHKVVDIVRQDGETFFQTQGIANEEQDPYLVPTKAYIGKVMFHVPMLGVLISFLRTDLGRVLFVVVPMTLLIMSESWKLAVAYFDTSESETDETEASTDESEFLFPPDEQLSESISAGLNFEQWSDVDTATTTTDGGQQTDSSLDFEEWAMIADETDTAEE